jgi:hypothetical protein
MTCDKRESSGTRKGKDNIRQNSKKKSLNLGKNFAPILLNGLKYLGVCFDSQLTLDKHIR